jgi:predicted dinucleotide-binding enzyme
MASDDEAAKRVASSLINQLGFDVVDAGPLSEGGRFERARPAFGERMNSDELRGALAAAGPDRAYRP